MADRGERGLSVPGMIVREVASAGRAIALDLEMDSGDYVTSLRTAERVLVDLDELAEPLAPGVRAEALALERLRLR